MVNAVKFPSARQDVFFIDPQTKAPVFTRPWFLFFQSLWQRQGGAISEGTDAVAIQGVFDPQVAALAVTLAELKDAELQQALAGDNTAAVAVLRNLIASLSSATDDSKIEYSLGQDSVAVSTVLKSLLEDTRVDRALDPDSYFQVSVLRRLLEDSLVEAAVNTPKQEVPDQGLWTPTLAGSTTAGTNTYTFQYGKWHRYRNQVTAHFYVRLASTAGMVGNLQLNGLPFSATAEASYRAVGGGFYWANLAAAVLSVSGVVRPSNNFVDLYAPGAASANAVPMPVGNVASASEISGSITYSL